MLDVQFGEGTIESKWKGPKDISSPVSYLKHSQLCIQTRLLRPLS